MTIGDLRAIATSEADFSSNNDKSPAAIVGCYPDECPMDGYCPDDEECSGDP